MLLKALTIAAYFVLANFAFAASGGAPAAKSGPQQLDVSADKSLEWYQDQSMYVARGNAKAIRGDMTVTADLLTAHQRPKADGSKSKQGNGDIDRMTAEGHVVITKPNAKITGDKAVDDLDQHVMVVTGRNLRYETDKQVVTARDSLEYWDEKKMAVARGHAVAIKGDRHVEGDVLSAEFRDQPNGQTQLYKMTAVGNVTVLTAKDVTRGDKAVYDAARDIAIVSGHVRITRADGTELSGDVGESDFSTNQSRLMNDGSGRVRALLPAKTSADATQNKGAKP